MADKVATMCVVNSRHGERKSTPSLQKSDIAFRVVSTLTALVLAWAWLHRAEPIWRASRGVGYALGILGLVLMLLLLAYPLRKRFLPTDRWGPTRAWFRIHMMLGVVGPAAIILHSNFRLGSTNSSAALISMLFVAGSGMIGRILYTRIHMGLSSERDTLAAARSRLVAAREQLMDASPGLAFELDDLHDWALDVPSTRRSLQLILGAPRLATVRSHATLVDDDPDLRRRTADYVRLLRRVAYFRVSERLFSVWHAFHLPLSLMLFATAVAHVVAVHLY